MCYLYCCCVYSFYHQPVSTLFPPNPLNLHIIIEEYNCGLLHGAQWRGFVGGESDFEGLFHECFCVCFIIFLSIFFGFSDFTMGKFLK